MTIHTSTPDAPGPVIARAGDSAEFLSLVPHLAGFRPRDSLVLVPFSGTRTSGAMRMDLPAGNTDPAVLPELAESLVGMFARVPADRVAVVVYTDDAFRDGHGRIARTALVEALLRCARAEAYEIVDALCVASDGWGSYVEPDAPYAPRPLAQIRPEAVDGPHAPDDPPLADQNAGCALPPSDLAERERVAREIAAVTLRLDDLALPTAFEDVIAAEDPPSPRSLAVLAVALDRPAIRDVALSQWCGGLAEGRRVQRFNIAWLAGEAVHFDGPARLAGEGDRPDPARLRRALELVKRVAAAAPRERRAGALAAAAWLSGALGRSTHAAHFLVLAREIDPDHGLCDIIATMLANAHLPQWVYDRAVPAPRNRAARRRAARARR
jgi:hypothetical protein